MLLEEAIRMLLIATRVEGRTPQTLEWYRQRLTRFLAFMGNVPVEQIRPNDLRNYLAHLMDQKDRWTSHPKLKRKEGGLSEYTIAGHFRALRKLFNWLESEGILDTNPMRRIKAPKFGQCEPKGIAESDLLALIETTKAGTVSDLRDRAIILVLTDTGCRLGGLCGLQVQDIDLKQEMAIVKEKGRKVRYIFLNPPTIEALKAWLAVRPEDSGTALFVSLGNKAKGPLSPNGVRQMLRRRAKQAGIKGPVNPHAFRHTFAREFLMKGGDLASLSDLLGHSSVMVTKHFYGTLTMRELKEKHKRYSPVVHLLKKGEGNEGDWSDS